MDSNRFSLNKEDLRKWSLNFLRFSAPSVLVALIGLQGGMDWHIALGMFASSFLTALIDITRKFINEG